jgi:hypothetical protein
VFERHRKSRQRRVLPEVPLSEIAVFIPRYNKGFSIAEIALCADGGEDSRFLASLGVTNVDWAKD